MITSDTTQSGHVSARSRMIWDPLVRLVHWSVALGVLLNATIIDEDGKWHNMIGYGVFGLVVVRLLWGFIGTKPARFASFPPNVKAAIAHFKELMRGDESEHLSHNPLGALMVYNLWASIIVISATGFMMGTNMFFGVEWVEELHEAVFGWLMVSVLFHVGGVIFESHRTGNRLVRAMITGEKSKTGAGKS